MLRVYGRKMLIFMIALAMIFILVGGYRAVQRQDLLDRQTSATRNQLTIVQGDVLILMKEVYNLKKRVARLEAMQETTNYRR